MVIFTKKYLGLLLLILLLGGFAKVKGQAHDSVYIRCVSVDAAGDVTLTWSIPSAASQTADGWQSYQVFPSKTGLPGSFPINPIATVTNPSTTFVTIPASNLLPLNANAAPIYFCIVTDNSITNYNSDTVSSMYLTVTSAALGGIANLNWNPISTPPPQGSSTWYQVYVEVNNSNNWSFVNSTQNLSFSDTITWWCSAYLNFRVQIADSNICVSTSNQTANTAEFHDTIPPPIPVMDTVSVTSNNTVDISWSKSPKGQVAGYIIYQEFFNSTYLAIDTVYGIDSISRINFKKGPSKSDSAVGNPSDSSLTFEVAAFDSCWNVGAISPAMHTIFLQQTPDPCTKSNVLNWNKYVDFVGSVGGYKIYVSVNSGAYTMLANVPPSVTTYTDNDLDIPELRQYYVQVYDSAHHDTTASSNRISYNIWVPKVPMQDYLRTASVVMNASNVNVEAYIDSASGAGYYLLQRTGDSTGKYETIDSIPSNDRYQNTINFFDNTANTNVQSYWYRIITLDSCENGLDTSNLGKTIYLSAVGDPDDTNVLTWNDYRNWYAGPKVYVIYRSTDGVNYSETGPPIYYSNKGENRYADYIKTDTQGNGTFYYYIKAVENNTGFYPFGDTSYSNIARAYQDPTIYIPTAFDPNGVNKVFIPKGVFLNVTNYDFVIVNRWGIKVFESNDPNVGWNGHYNNSKKAEQEDVYVYLLTYTSSKGEYFQMKGTVTLLK